MYVLLQNIDLMYDSVSAKRRVFAEIRSSPIIVSFIHKDQQNQQQPPHDLTGSGVETKKSEIAIDFVEEDKFPSALYITCCSLQVVVH